MIKKINKIKNLGLVFSDYSWSDHVLSGTTLPSFKRYNLIYGWNGTGKTTLTKLFDAVEDSSLTEIAELEYEIEDEEQNKYKQGEQLNNTVRVFNQDYIDKNLEIRAGKAKSITLILGDSSKQIVEQIKNDEIELSRMNDELKKFRVLLEQTEKNKGKVFTEIAKTIYVAIIGGAIRTYRKDNAESDLKLLTQKELLSDEELNRHSIAVKQSSKPAVEIINQISIEADDGNTENLSDALRSLAGKAKSLLSSTVESQIINRLKNNQDISCWVEAGMEIHQHHKSANCEFCGQILPKDRLLTLSKHFNEADKKLKTNLDNLAENYSTISNLISALSCPDSARFYDEIHKNYEKLCSEYDTEKTKLLKEIEGIKKLLQDKKTRTTEGMTFDKNIDPDKFTRSLDKIIDVIEQHNKKTSDFENEKETSVKKLKKHYLSNIFDEIIAFDKDLASYQSETDKLNNGDPANPDNLGVINLKKRISENQARISSTHKACEEINKGLATFLGRDELIFEPNKTKVANEKGEIKEIDDGYIIKRHSKPVFGLSEGEKNAIAFVYFTIHLKDQDFDIANGIIVIDDPVSSLDSNSVFQAFAFLKNAVKDAEQVFIFTHNFDFLRLLLNWVKNADRTSACFYMIKNYYTNDRRCAYLDKMDKELCDYESEYHYLFKKLKEFKSDGTIGQAYPIPNIARKVLDTFLLFRVPCGGRSYEKLEKIRETTKFDPNKLTAIYKFTNDQSHITGSGFDPALVQETQKNVTYLLEMIEEVFPEHYQILIDSIDN